jgi:lipid-A-disaccharide synthase
MHALRQDARRTVLFTAFEPSGDAHAAPVIRAIRERKPHWRVVALGGRRMAAAGAEVLIRTADDGSMVIPAWSKVQAVRRAAAFVTEWVAQHPVAVHVPVDSPAANFPICARTRAAGAKIVHLVAPQLWAWAPWRIHKLRRLTDHVCCLLPFEQEWFRSRGVPATFVGHPVINRGASHDPEAPPTLGLLPEGSPRVLLLPGSRQSEVDRNARLLVRAFEAVRTACPEAVALVVAASADAATRFARKVPVMPERMAMATGAIDAGVAWCDMAVAVSGTVTLDVARQRKPMIGVYRTGLVSWLGSHVILQAPNRLLPNVLAGRRIVPEFVPCWRGVRVPAAARALATSKDARDAQWKELDALMRTFDGHDPAAESTRIIIAHAETG